MKQPQTEVIYSQYQSQRDKLQEEINNSCIPKLSFEIFNKTPEQRVLLANLKAKNKMSNNMIVNILNENKKG